MATGRIERKIRPRDASKLRRSTRRNLSQQRFSLPQLSATPLRKFYSSLPSPYMARFSLSISPRLHLRRKKRENRIRVASISQSRKKRRGWGRIKDVKGESTLLSKHCYKEGEKNLELQTNTEKGKDDKQQRKSKDRNVSRNRKPTPLLLRKPPFDPIRNPPAIEIERACFGL